MISGNHNRLEAGNKIRILSSENKSTTIEDYKANRKQDIEELNRNTENSLNKRKEISVSYTHLDVYKRQRASTQDKKDTISKSNTTHASKEPS